MEKELDSFDICRIRENSLLFFLMFMLQFGEVIFFDFYYFLDYFCIYIDFEEYVVYEIFDFIIDEKYNFDIEFKYVLVKVIEINGERDGYLIEYFWIISYLIDIGNGQ